MSFASPAFLFLLVMVPGLVALYFRKSRPIRRVVPSNKLWEIVCQRLDENSLFQRYRNSIFLALQLAVILALVFGLARPYLSRALIGRIVIVLDTSASMRSTDVAPDRFARAKEKALSLVRSLDTDGRVALVTADSHVVVRAGFETEPEIVLGLLKQIEATDHPGPDVEELLTTMEGLLRLKPDNVFVLTDQLKAQELADRVPSVGLSVLAFGRRSENVAVARLEVRPVGGVRGAPSAGRPPPGPADRWEAEVVVTNFAPGPVKTTVVLSQNGRTLASRPLGMGGRADARLRVPDLKLETGLVMAQVQASPAENNLEADDRAWAHVGGGQASVLLVGRSTGPLSRILRATAGIRLSTVSSLDAMKVASLPDADLVVGDGVTHADLARRPALVFCSPDNPGPATTGFVVGPCLENPAITRLEATHPLLKYLSFRDVWFRAAARLKLEPGDVEVLGSSGGPLVVARSSGGVRQVLCAFTTDVTNFSSRVGFPIFVVNCLRWIGGERMAGTSGVKLGESFFVPPGFAGDVRVVGPDGQERRPARPGLRMLPPDLFPRAGLHKLKVGDRELAVPAVLANFAESAIAPAQESDLVRKSSSANDPAQGSGPAGLSAWLVALALMVMVGEWALYARTGG